MWPYDTLLFTDDTQVHSLQVGVSGGCGTPPCPNWGIGLGSNASPLLQIPGTDKAYIGLANGDLRELTLDRVTPTNFPASRTFTLSPSAVGGPTFSVPQLMIYVGDSGGSVYGIPWPIP